VILSLFVSVDDMDVLRWCADHMLFRVDIGERPCTPTMLVRDLFVGITLRRPLIVPVRQTVYVFCDMTAPPPELRDFQVTFHIDGLETTDIS
jgi:hypothetical protein